MVHSIVLWVEQSMSLTRCGCFLQKSSRFSRLLAISWCGISPLVRMAWPRVTGNLLCVTWQSSHRYCRQLLLSAHCHVYLPFLITEIKMVVTIARLVAGLSLRRTSDIVTHSVNAKTNVQLSFKVISKGFDFVKLK